MPETFRDWIMSLPSIGPARMPVKSSAPSDFAALRMCEAAGIELRFIGLEVIEATAGRITFKLNRGHHART